MKKRKKSDPVTAQPEEPCSSAPRLSATWKERVAGDQNGFYPSMQIDLLQGGSASLHLNGPMSRYPASNSGSNSGHVSGVTEDNLRCLARKFEAAADQMRLWGMSD